MFIAGKEYTYILGKTYLVISVNVHYNNEHGFVIMDLMDKETLEIIYDYEIEMKYIHRDWSPVKDKSKIQLLKMRRIK